MQVLSTLPRKDPASLGIPSRAILNFIDAIEESGLELHSFMLLRHGCVAAEGWWAPYRPEFRHALCSLTKSFTSTGIGLAVMEGRLSVDDPVISFFPDDLPAEISENLASMRIRHLLSMSTGHAEDTAGKLFEGTGAGEARAFLGLPVEYQPGTRFVYNSGASHMLSAIITKVTGQTLFDYLKPRLFEPLGIEDATWDLSPGGINTGGWGLSIRTEDIARFGQLYLNLGVWRGKQIISKEWVREATSVQISTGDWGASDWAQGYGYQFWRCRHGAYRGDGLFGQSCIVMPQQDAVVAITAGVKDMQAVLNHVWDRLLAAMGSEPVAESDEDREALARKVSSLAILPPVTRCDSPAVQRVSGRHFSVTSPGGDAWDLTLSFDKDQCLVEIDDRNGHYHLNCGLGRWLVSDTVLLGSVPGTSGAMKVALSGGWSNDNTFQITIRSIEVPHLLGKVICHFGDDIPRVEYQEIR